jgi:preprotein translocase subunit SecG
MTFLIMAISLLLSFVLIVLILMQRGKGGGLAGALGGMGGQSAFGTKAGDLFMWVTAGVATVWILLAIVAVKYFSSSSDKLDVRDRTEVSQSAETPASPAPVGGESNSPAGAQDSKSSK